MKSKNGFGLVCGCAVLVASSGAMAESPERASADAAARAVTADSDASAELPPPEVMIDVWRVPLGRPYAVKDADMLRLGLEQQFSAPAERSARRRAGALRAEALRAEGTLKERVVSLRLAHARAEQDGAEHSHVVHRAHLKLAERVLELARARHAAGGPLVDVTNAEIEAARAAADVAGDQARAESARALVATLREVPEPSKTSERPELAALRLSRAAELADADAEQARSRWPDFRVGVSYFAPTSGRDEHGFGVTLGMKLPWLWGSQSGKRRAADARAQAIEQELLARRRDFAADAVEARGALNVALRTLSALREQVLPALERASELSRSGYESGQIRLEDVLRAEAERVETEMEIVRLEAEVAHRRIDLAYIEGSVAAQPQETNHVR